MCGRGEERSLDYGAQCTAGHELDVLQHTRKSTLLAVKSNGRSKTPLLLLPLILGSLDYKVLKGCGSEEMC